MPSRQDPGRHGESNASISQDEQKEDKLRNSPAEVCVDPGCKFRHNCNLIGRCHSHHLHTLVMSAEEISWVEFYVWLDHLCCTDACGRKQLVETVGHQFPDVQSHFSPAFSVSPAPGPRPFPRVVVHSHIPISNTECCIPQVESHAPCAHRFDRPVRAAGNRHRFTAKSSGYR